MGKILSQEEIDLLLGSAAELHKDVPDDSPSIAAVTYDFRRTNQVSKDQVRSLQMLHERFARNASASLSAYLRWLTEISIVSVEQLTYAEFLMSLPDPTAFYALALTPGDGVAALDLNPTLAFAMIDRILGGSGTDVKLTRALTEIEQHVVDGIVNLLIDNLSSTWKHVHEVQFRITGRETRPQMLQVAAPTEPVVLLAFDVRMGEVRGMLNVCLPVATIEALGDVFAQGWFRSRREPTPIQREALMESLRRVHVPVSAQLGITMPAREVVQLQPGDVISLERPITSPVKVQIAGTAKFAGRLVRAGSRIGVVLSEAAPGAAARAGAEGA